MARILNTAFLLFVVTTTDLLAQNPVPKFEDVVWAPKRDIKKVVDEEIEKFHKQVKETIGKKNLSFKPFVVKQEVSPEQVALKEALEAKTVEDMVDGSIRHMKNWADHESDEFIPKFSAYRSRLLEQGSNLDDAPHMHFGTPDFGNIRGNVTFEIHWETSNGHFKKEWDHNDVDEAYEVQLHCKLRMGINFSVWNEERLVVVSHLVEKPLVQDWQLTLVASEGTIREEEPLPGDKAAKND
jgi:hypothetical protein